MAQEQKIAEHKSTKEDAKRARGLRNSASFVERKLWRVLSVQSRLCGLRFRRQHPLHPFIIDFACLSVQLLVEIDGASHDSTQVYDIRRDTFLKSLGYEILRFRNQQVCENVEGVVAEIIDVAEKRKALVGSLDRPPP